MLSKGFLMNINGIDIDNIILSVEIPYNIIIDSIVPLYVKDSILYNGDEQICPISENLVPYLIYAKVFTLTPKRFLVWKPQICVVLVFEKELSVIQVTTVNWYLVSGSNNGSKLNPLHPNAIILDNIVLEKFEVNDEIVEGLKKIETLEEMTKYLVKEMMLSVI